MKILQQLTFIKKIDWWLLTPVLFLIAFGLATLYSGVLNISNPDWTLFNKQITFFVLGLIFLLVASQLDYRFFRSFTVLLYIVAIILMIAVLFWGQTIRGTMGWFQFLGFSFQPVELSKFALVVILAHLYARRTGKEKKITTILLVLIATLIPVALAIQQPDLGSAFVLLGIGGGFLGLLSIKPQQLIFIIIVGILLGSILWNAILLDYQKERVLNFIDPMRDPLGRGYNVRQSIIAVGAGQLIGRGLGLGTQSQLRFLPETSTDFIFANIAESLGFLGASAIIILLIIIFFRMIILMRNTKDEFSTYLIYGFGLIFFIHAVINIGMNIGIMPVTGISLPFVSYGGSFLLMCMVAIGIIESIAIRQK